MTMLTQKKLNLQMKILKIAKGLNKFTLPDILPMLEENEKTIQKALNDLETLPSSFQTFGFPYTFPFRFPSFLIFPLLCS